MSKKVNSKFKLVLILVLIISALLALWLLVEGNDYCEQNHPGIYGDASKEYLERCGT
jgi:hypothetical protein